jgi:8-oxo-dGTP pyrophosphatase MutT (NUDIX family)
VDASYAPIVSLSVAARRLGYRVAFRLLQLRWRLLRPVQEGVKCMITDGDRLLLVRHTYGSRAWELPGGSSHRDESPLVTAQREMEEELGLGDAPWRLCGELRGRTYGRHDRIHVVAAEVRDPVLRVDPVEIEAVAWFERERLPLWTGPLLDPVVRGAAHYAFGAPQAN